MRPKHNPNQLSLFLDLADNPNVPSIATMPNFDHALGNLIKMSDLGAFIQINIQGIEKVYSLNLRELDIPKDFLKSDTPLSPLTVHLFPHDVRNKLKNLTYEVKSFFNSGNSFKTSFGFFLFRNHFPMWKSFLDERKNELNQYLSDSFNKGVYGQYFLDHFLEGYDYFHNTAALRAPWNFQGKILLKDIQEKRNFLMDNHATLTSLRATEIDFPFQVLVFKTAHIPLVFHQYQAQVHIRSVFKSIHLDYLVGREINTIEDVRKLIAKL